MKTLVNLNAAAAAVFAGRDATKARVDVRDGVLFLRPTTRKANTVLTDLVTKGKTASIEISGKQSTKLGATLTAASFGLAETKYGWLKVTEQGAEGNIEGAVVELTLEDEPVAAPEGDAPQGDSTETKSEGAGEPAEA